MLRMLVIASFALGAFSASMDFENVARFAQKTSIAEEAWNAFKETYDKSYDSPKEEEYRKQVFADNLQTIETHNYLHAKGLKSFTMGINKYSDMEIGEFKKLVNGFKRSKGGRKGASYLPLNADVDLPKEVDWRNKGYVTGIKDQGMCGSCWAFSAIGSLEGQNFRKTMNLVSLSEQNLVDCSRPEGNEGCAGGFMDWAFQYIQNNDGVDTEASYPYTAKDGKCMYNAANKGATDTGFVDIASGNETMLKESVAMVGPISVAIDAGHQSFLQYSGGIYDNPKCSTEDLDHGVVVVGYGTENGQDYWIIKNSWGMSWGEHGYGRMSRNKRNQCGIATMASYPLV